ncbi:hypothetical protein DPSP01_005196 [Paraphaeosphaeria sporulosa]
MSYTHSTEHFDLVVVGAGLYGITAAATYHEVHPHAKILVVESSPSLGGPWSPQRTFPGLKTNNLFGTYQVPDFPMDAARFRVKQGEHIPARKVFEYLQALVEDRGLKQHIQYNTKVRVVEEVKGGWRLHVSISNSNVTEEAVVINASKLIVAVGLTNQPSMPHYPTSPEFKPIVIHSSRFASQFSEIVKEGTHTLVVGGGKSAWDITYACATQPNSTATMLIRPSGNGPSWMAPSHVTPLGLWLEKLVFTRFFGYMSPCPWAEMTGLEGWLRGFFHGTWLGKKIMAAFWQILGDDVIQLNKLHDHPETEKLRPWRDAFETGNGLSIMNYPTNWFDLVGQGKIKIVIDEIEQLGNENKVQLKSGETIKVDAVVCATGWKIGGGVEFKPEGLRYQLGLPTTEAPDVEDEALIRQVTNEIYERYPFLKNRDTSRVHHPDPTLRHAASSQTVQQPYRLHRFLVPPAFLQQRSIGFAGAVSCLGNAPCAYLQGLWLTAYLDGTLKLPEVSSENIRREMYRDTQYCALRHAMGYGDVYPDIVFDSLPYFDALMQDLGFEGKRKGYVLGCRNWVAESFQSYAPEDYKGLVDEWKRRMALETEGKKTE